MTTHSVKHIPGAGLLKGTAYVVILLLTVPSWVDTIAWWDITKTFGVFLTDTGTHSFTTASGYFLACLVTGWLFKRLDAGSTLLIGSILAGIATLGYAFAPNWGFVEAFGFLYGAGKGIIFAGLVIHFMTRFSTRSMIWLFACYSAAGITQLLLQDISFTLITWRIGYLLAAIVYGVVVALFAATRSLWNINWYRDDEQEPIRVGTILSLFPVWIAIALFLISSGLTAAVANNWPILVGNLGRDMGFDQLTLWKTVSSVVPLISLLTVVLLANRINWRFMVWLCATGTVIGAALAGFSISAHMHFAGYTLMVFAVVPLFSTLLIHVKQHVSLLYLPVVVGWLIAATGIGGDIIARILSTPSATSLIVFAVFTLTILLVAIFELSVWFNAPKKKKGIPERPLEDAATEIAEKSNLLDISGLNSLTGADIKDTKDAIG